MTTHEAAPRRGRYWTTTATAGPVGTGRSRTATPEPRGGGSDGAGRAGLVPQLTLAAVCAAYALGSALGWGSRTVALIMGDFGLSAAAFLAAGSCLWYARTLRAGAGQRGESGQRDVSRPAWVLFGISSLMAALGNGVWGWYELVLGELVPRPSMADFCFLLFAPPAIVGLLVLAKRPVTRAGWACLSLDAWLIGGSLLTLSWSLALAHTAYWQGDSVARAALNLAYPLLDIVLVSMVLVLHFRRASAHRSAINTAIGALALTVLCDALFTSPMLRERYASGQILDAGWFAGSLLLAYAPWVARRESRDAQHEAEPEPLATAREAEARATHPSRPIAGSLTALTPYLAAAVCTLGILYNSLDGREIDRVVLFTGCTVVLALVLRQGIMLLDNITLTQELAQKENHFRSLVQGSSDVIMIAASTGILRYVSPAAAGVYGREADQLVGSELSSLVHPEDLGQVLHELRRFLATSSEHESCTRIECRFRHGDGHWLNVESTVNRYQGGLIFNSRDVTERVRLQAQLQHNASHDALTDLPNRALFTERVRQAIGGRRGGDCGTAVLFIDLDGFKAVNDTVGHQAGDELLVQAARRLHESVRSGDTAARLGGDEFAVLIRGDGEPGQTPDAERELRIHDIADRLRLTLSDPYRVEGTEVRVAASIGIAFAEPGITPSALMRNADLAMYRAKQAGKARVELYAPQMQAEVVKRAELAARLRSALHDGEFALLHQPIVELSSGKVTAVAAEARWRSAQGILFTPAEFLRTEGASAREARGAGGERAAEVSRWLLEEAVQQAAARQRAGYGAPVTVRLPARRLTEPGMEPRSVGALLARHGLAAAPGHTGGAALGVPAGSAGLPGAPGALILELSDSDPRIPLDELERRLTALRRLGVLIALDGFGSGISGGASISALRRLPVDILRLDRGLTDGIVESSRQRKITAGLLRIAGDLGLTTVAEGVDLPEQATLLREMGCTHGQGAVFAGPLDEHRLRRALARGVYAVPESTRSGGASGHGEEHPGSHQGGHPGTRPGGRAVAVAGALPVRQGGTAGPDPVTHSPLRSNAETPVPPT
ncbi:MULTISPECIES: diguanylate cyclase domain-containing protein [unclassified Streptomyces]|uniref:putative bifunctional diguanylate cyclase/phosphodiesterase n=1 Tax=unclassified Streptomyces TaxID=2593676 RepID=UPI002DD99A4E|nr:MULTISPECIES: EAL domain-containing protein [unclassified Streptomyces]WSA92171.1 diguanylate cyclase [Streptomyces sp. NBC_01795]WSB76536.1 diguanylate cyclase [Streptomyces sp. NBC_01775]WSS15175.1 diguanylate cyclase [Streptomyces sp. NBC_01186]WSS44017.1 diguanylate cyclase [Streptomyces sp. NBC_01187]